MSKKTYRRLTEGEIATLERQGCTCSDWDGVTVAKGTDLKHVRDSRFSGEVRLGLFEKSFTMPGGIKKHSGVRNATLHNVSIGDNCCIENIKNYIANYEIGNDTFIENVDIILIDKPTMFGNGVEVSVLIETGGREVTMHDRLTAHEAYIEAMYRHRPDVVGRLKEMARRYSETKKSELGRIGDHVVIVDAGYIKNVRVGDHCQIEGAGRLRNGTIASEAEAPSHVGYGVVLDDFIMQSGSSVDDGAMMTRCFIGQGCKMSHHYSASDSLFFSNCHGENGEACAIFAGPYTVTHHKSTLLIAGMFSFMNAGSGSNQSNHMYKLGPIHQGHMERGAKTASGSYILWPARIGAFSLVMGRVVGNVDTSDLPYSYIIESNGSVSLAPAVNLRSVGTIRDAQKWPKRDKRTGRDKLDQINFNLLSPYTMQKALRGIKLLKGLRETCGRAASEFTYQGMKITNKSLKRGLKLYDTAITKFLGNSVIQRLKDADLSDQASLRKALKPESEVGLGEWADMAGLIAPKSEIERLIGDTLSGRVDSVEALNARLAEMHRAYYEMEWPWAYATMLEYFGIDEETLTAADIIGIVERWKASVVELDEMVYADAKKEFSLSAKTGFGADGSHFDADRDFEQVRGQFERNSFVQAVADHIAKKSALGDRMLEKLKKII